MRALLQGQVEDLAISPVTDNLIEPVFADVRSALEIASEKFAGAGSRVQPGTLAKECEGESRWTGEYTWMPRTYAEQQAIFQHQHYSQGRLRAFWMPSWVSDFRVSQDISPASGNLIKVLPAGFEYVFRSDAYGIMIIDNTRTFHIHKIERYEESGKLWTKSALNFTVAASNIYRAMLVRRCRYDTDNFQFAFRKDTYFEVSAPLIEVLGEGGFTP